MAPKQQAAAAVKAKQATKSYQDMISEAIINLKERSGSSRQSIKKYIKANNQINVASDKQFDGLVNKALRSGVEKGVFEQPKGPSGGTKLKKKTAAAKPAAAEKTETKKAAPATKAAAAKPATKKAAPAKKAPVKKTTAAKAKPAAKAPAKKAAPKKKTTTTAAPAVVEKPTTLTKTKSGRVAKTTAQPAATKKAPAKKAAAKKAKA